MSNRLAIPSSERVPERIVVIQTAFLGDVVFTSPLVAALKGAWPAATLTFVSSPKAAGLASCIVGVDRVVPFDKRGADRGLKGLRRVAKELGAGIDLVVVPHPSLRSAALARLTGADFRVGGDRGVARYLYNVRVPVRPREPFVERFLDLARAIGVSGTPRLSMRAPAIETEKARAVLGTRRCIGLVVGSEWGTKRWMPESFAALADLADEAGFTPVLFGAPNERSLAEQVKSALKRAKPVDLVGNGILESVGALSLLEAVVGGDSGLLHVSRALGVPSVLLFGPTDPGAHVFEPYAQALRVGIPCQPCHAHGPKVCPLGHHDCMRLLSTERVWAATASLARRGEAA